MKTSNKWIVAGVMLILFGSFCVAYEVVNRFTGEAFTVKDITIDGSGKAVKTIVFEHWEHCKTFWMWFGLTLITIGSFCQIIGIWLDKLSNAQHDAVTPSHTKTSAKFLETLGELRALYDIRVKEIHHYNTIIWAFPVAYAALLGSEIHFLNERPWSLIVAAIFNFVFVYVFCHHLRNMRSIRVVLKHTEDVLADQYGREFVPDFQKSLLWFLPKPTALMKWSLIIVTSLFLLRAIYTKCGC
jgi:hypothetical protein